MMDTPFFAGQDKTANLIWCDDPSWWLTTDIDLNTTYIGGDVQLIEAVLESTVLEALPASPDDDITIHSDKLNFIDASDGNSSLP